ncbi:hypothetical protein L195_g011507 [Trifolium pratense]|uniref:Uncharacterized protein n=1 Tax=Trifolium pratense TaxID=57577 RepID=A0A2K3PHP9_TRIPR|nr:hypothetical protein L195_g011507 [Trifolium pratense]
MDLPSQHFDISHYPPPSMQHATSSILLSCDGTSYYQFHFALKLLIKLGGNNFQLWIEQVEGVIASHKLHRLVVNPTVP